MNTTHSAIALAALREIATFDPTRLDAATLGNIARATLARIDGETGGRHWRAVPHGGAFVLENREGADIGHVYRTPGGVWCANPWGREIRHFSGDTAAADARAYVEVAMA